MGRIGRIVQRRIGKKPQTVAALAGKTHNVQRPLFVARSFWLRVSSFLFRAFRGLSVNVKLPRERRFTFHEVWSLSLLLSLV